MVVPHGLRYNLGILSEHISDGAIGRYIDHFSCFFHFLSQFFLRLCSVCEHKCGWLAIQICKVVQISYSQKFPTKWAWNIMEYFLKLFFYKRAKAAPLSYRWRGLPFCSVTLASMTLWDMHVVEVQVPFVCPDILGPQFCHFVVSHNFQFCSI